MYQCYTDELMIHEDGESAETIVCCGCERGFPATNWIPGCLYLMVREGADLSTVLSSSSTLSYTVEIITSRVALHGLLFLCGMCLINFSPR